MAYQLAVVVDDGLMGISEVVRGCDLLGSTARQIYLAGLLGLTPPRFGHVPLLMSPDGRRLSKRDHDLDLGAIRDRGVSPRRVIGRLAGLVGLAELVGDEGSLAWGASGNTWTISLTFPAAPLNEESPFPDALNQRKE